MPPHTNHIENSVIYLNNSNNGQQVFNSLPALSSSSSTIINSNSSNNFNNTQNNFSRNSAINNNNNNNNFNTATSSVNPSQNLRFNNESNNSREDTSSRTSQMDDYIGSYPSQFDEILNLDLCETNIKNEPFDVNDINLVSLEANLSVSNFQPNIQFDNYNLDYNFDSLTTTQSNNTYMNNNYLKPLISSCSAPNPSYMVKQEDQDESNSSFSCSSEPLPSSNKRMSVSSSRSSDNPNNMHKSLHEKRYGPIVVRPRKNPAPTLSSGRKSKYTLLPADEDRKREIRRDRNRKAAEKCKQKRNEIEHILENEVKNLIDLHKRFKDEQDSLNKTKNKLEQMLKDHENCTNQYSNNPKQQTTTLSNNSNSILAPYQLSQSSYPSQPQQLQQQSNLGDYSMIVNTQPVAPPSANYNFNLNNTYDLGNSTYCLTTTSTQTLHISSNLIHPKPNPHSSFYEINQL